MKRNIILLLIFLNIFNVFSLTERAKVVNSIFKSVEKWFGSKYSYGGESKTGVDCSGLVVQVYKDVFHKDLPRTVAEQRKIGVAVINKLEPGDLLFFRINGTISHVGIYLFDNKFVHAASAGAKNGVIKSSLEEPYYRERYIFAKRVVDLPAFKK
jgi:cell wall-associated NlpC family hydrolase